MTLTNLRKAKGGDLEIFFYYRLCRKRAPYKYTHTIKYLAANIPYETGENRWNCLVPCGIFGGKKPQVFVSAVIVNHGNKNFCSTKIVT